jgi:hypothetical protein
MHASLCIRYVFVETDMAFTAMLTSVAIWAAHSPRKSISVWITAQTRETTNATRPRQDEAKWETLIFLHSPSSEFNVIGIPYFSGALGMWRMNEQ